MNMGWLTNNLVSPRYLYGYHVITCFIAGDSQLSRKGDYFGLLEAFLWETFKYAPERVGICEASAYQVKKMNQDGTQLNCFLH